ncbi:hypothetical protein BaRGS_00011949 [Batillaria attramentaria]|uniref:Deoxynucleoside kinase domain-containing protein n=1 Tax=Batillaria attramentaria TaxID=370345 RepID=A0ABD0LBM4_9CAEN
MEGAYIQCLHSKQLGSEFVQTTLVKMPSFGGIHWATRVTRRAADTSWKDFIGQRFSLARLLRQGQQNPGKSRAIFFQDTVAVEGNIGCGKTTFLEYFKKHTNVEVLPEPVDKWKSVNGYNCFELMYQDTVRWSLAFQSYVTLTMLENHEQPENLHKKGLMSDMEHAVLEEWHNWIGDNADTGLDLIVYLRASPEVCQERIKIRNRSEESCVSLDYLQDLHRLHEDWLINKKCGSLPAPVLVIDANVDLPELTKKIEELTPNILFQQ